MRIIQLLGRNLKTFLLKIYNYFSINIYVVDFSVQFYVYRNQNIRGIILDKICNYHAVLVEAYNRYYELSSDFHKIRLVKLV